MFDLLLRCYNIYYLLFASPYNQFSRFSHNSGILLVTLPSYRSTNARAAMQLLSVLQYVVPLCNAKNESRNMFKTVLMIARFYRKNMKWTRCADCLLNFFDSLIQNHFERDKGEVPYTKNNNNITQNKNQDSRGYKNGRPPKRCELRMRSDWGVSKWLACCISIVSNV